MTAKLADFNRMADAPSDAFRLALVLRGAASCTGGKDGELPLQAR